MRRTFITYCIFISWRSIPEQLHRIAIPALIEYPAFDHVRALRGDGRGLASACACEDRVGGLRCVIWGELVGFRG